MARLKLVTDIFANALERKRSTTETNKLRDEAQKVARLALVGEMAAAVAHELNHPLGAILANAQAARRLLENSHPKLSELRETLDDVISGERRAAAYVEKVRSLFNRSEVLSEPLQVDRFLESIASLTRSELAARGISLQIQIEANLPMIAADRVGIEQVLMNLIQNAADA
ncbi:MAG TPA: histidine kinase dimerization/phospho-acceptor domain-containing protein, partial [Nitrospira sp.]|nr:histidine kinase dimerization/phospho-acceptor domain-containing protein [Nitrospira sp.]